MRTTCEGQKCVLRLIDEGQKGEDKRLSRFGRQRSSAPYDVPVANGRDNNWIRVSICVAGHEDLTGELLFRDKA